MSVNRHNLFFLVFLVIVLLISAAYGVTRFYLPASGAGAAQTSPTYVSWTRSVEADRVRMVLKPRKVSSASSNKTALCAPAFTTDYVLVRQYVSDPVAGQSIAGTVRGQALCREYNAGQNATLAVMIKIVGNDGTAKSTLLGITASTNTAATTTEFSTATLQNRPLLNATDGTLLSLSAQTTTNGDRIVVELGYREMTTKSTYTGTLVFGDTSASDLADGDTASSAVYNPWIEFSQDIVFPDVRIIMDAD